jgi:hypothetical protein
VSRARTAADMVGNLVVAAGNRCRPNRVIYVPLRNSPADRRSDRADMPRPGSDVVLRSPHNPDVSMLSASNRFTT